MGAQTNRKQSTNSAEKKAEDVTKLPSAKSERIVVDEIIDIMGSKDSQPTVRLLRAKRAKNSSPADFGIGAWNDERESIMKVWQVEAFIGLKSPCKLMEGDVFFIIDGSRLDKHYGTNRCKIKRYVKPLPRDEAAKIHLLRPIEGFKEIARAEIKREFHKLSASNTTSDKKTLDNLMLVIDKKIEDDLACKGKKGGK
jgi:hypothetical protein